MTGGGAVRFDGEDDEQVIWQDIAELKVCGEECSPVFHEITGSIHVTFEDSDETPGVADFEFRVIDEHGKVLCKKRVRYAVGVPENIGDLEIIAPFHIKCFDKLDRCDDKHHTYRLQADLLDERLAKNNTVWVQDVDWAAIVWEPKDHDGYDD